MPPRSGVNEKGTAPPFNPLNTTGLRGAPASETKTKGKRIATVRSGIWTDIPPAAVQQDGQDPQLLTNLQKLGAVEVPRGKLSYQRSNPMLNILSARRQNAEAEREAQELAARQGSNSSPATLHNRMSVSTIVAMLDARKECRSQRELEELARGFDIDLDLLQNLARYVNAPSVDVNARARRRKLGVKVEENDEVSGHSAVGAVNY